MEGEQNTENKQVISRKLGNIGLSELKYPLLVLIPALILMLFTISQLKQFPGPIYGGDIYWHFGETLDIYNGASPISNHQVTGEYAYYGWLTQFLIALTSKITFISLETVYMYFPAVLLVLAGIVSYFLGMEFFGERIFAIMLCIATVSGAYTIMDILRVLGDYVLMMAFLLFTIKAVRKERIVYSILAGISMGLGGLTHIVALPAMAVFLFFLFVYRAFFTHIHVYFNPKEMKLSITETDEVASIKKNLLVFAPIFIAGLMISTLFFGPILLVYRAEAKNPLQEYTEPDMSAHGTEIFFQVVGETFLNFSSPMSIVFSGMLIAGIYFAIVKRREITSRIILILLFSAFVSGFHYFITLPLFGRALIPLYFFTFLMKTTSMLIFVYAAKQLAVLSGESRKNLIAYVIAAFLFVNLVSSAIAAHNSQWVVAGRNEKTLVFDEISGWIEQNTGKDDVFLAPEELSFAVNGISARKIVISRRTHFSPYMDIDQRIADAAVIMYGNSSQKTAELLEHYNVSYFYWDANWLAFAQREPSLTSPKYEGYLSENGVYFQKTKTYLDPAYESTYPQYDVLVIYPSAEDASKPWSSTFDSYISLAKTFYLEGREYARIYRIEN